LEIFTATSQSFVVFFGKPSLLASGLKPVIWPKMS
jgi:hypothetical protein